MHNLYFVRLDAYQAGKLVEFLSDCSFNNAYDDFFSRHLITDIIEQFASQMTCEDFTLWHSFARNIDCD